MLKRLLVANRGEIARRVIRAAHGLSIEAVAVYSESEATAPFVGEADAAVALPGRSARESYLDIAALLEAAERTGCDSVHPGYGFLAESAAFARAVGDAGLCFVGPSPEVIAALGDKLAAAAVMEKAGVPVLSSQAPSGDLAGLSYPVMVKAAAGGGGKGMRLVTEPAELEESVAAARREAAASFGDDRVFLEPYLSPARHVEVQIFGDKAGNLAHLFERECSIQRRHQKVIEEAPSPAVGPELRGQMGEAALRAAKAVGYENAGTVEFLLDDSGGFYFLEVNTRIQVEHPVTEEITGVDLVREQLLVASGESLSFSTADLSINGHAIEARLYAENPAEGFLPVTGRVGLFEPADLAGLRYEASVAEGSLVGPEFDPLLAKVIAHSATREEASSLLARGLEQTELAGLVTNRDFLVSVLRDEAFSAGDTTTDFIERRRPSPIPTAAPETVGLAAMAAAVSASNEARAAAPVLASLPSGFRVGVMPPERRRYSTGLGEVTVEYRQTRDGSFEVRVQSEGGGLASEHRLVARGGTSERPLFEIDGISRPLRLRKADALYLVRVGLMPPVELRELARFAEPETSDRPGEFVAPMPGSVLSVHVTEGDEVTEGQLLVVVEAMKMEHRVTAPAPGRIERVLVTPGSQVGSGDLLVALVEIDRER